MSKKTFRVPRRTAEEYEALRQKAAILYIKYGKSAAEICKELIISHVTVSTWNKQGNWNDLKPDLQTLTEYKAAHLYIVKNTPTSQISQLLSIPEHIIKIWVLIYGWDVLKMMQNSKEAAYDIVADFCQHFIKLYPQQFTAIQTAKQSYSKKRIRSEYNPKY